MLLDVKLFPGNILITDFSTKYSYLVIFRFQIDSYSPGLRDGLQVPGVRVFMYGFPLGLLIYRLLSTRDVHPTSCWVGWM